MKATQDTLAAPVADARPAATPLPPKSARLKRIQADRLALLVLAGFVNYLDRSTLAIANQTISGELGYTPTEMGLLLSAFAWAYAFAQLPIGGLLDRFGARLTLGLGICLWSLAQGVLGLLSSLHLMILARIGLGIGEAPQFPAGAKVVSEWFTCASAACPPASSTCRPRWGRRSPSRSSLRYCCGWAGGRCSSPWGCSALPSRRSGT